MSPGGGQTLRAMSIAPPAYLERFPISDGTAGHVEVDAGVSLRIVERGATDPDPNLPLVVLIHGLASNARMWDGVAAALATQKVRTIAVDLRGHGRSDRPDHGYDFATVGGDVCRMLDAFDVDRAVMVGQSWGGNVVVDMAHRYPERVVGAVAVDGGMIDLQRTFPDWDDCAQALHPPRLTGTRAGRFEAAIRSMHSDWPETGIVGALSNFEVLDDGTIQPWLRLEHHMTILRELWQHRPSDLYPEIERPILFVPADSGDVAWTRNKDRAVDEALSVLKRGRAHWFRPAHHDVHAQHPIAVAEVLVTNLRNGFLS